MPNHPDKKKHVINKLKNPIDKPFMFGKNWENYVKKKISEDRVKIAQDHLLNFLKVPDLSGKSFLDIGCGSGIHSLAAWRAKASFVFSVDADPKSVSTTRLLHQAEGSPANWRVAHGSVLDETAINTWPAADIVFCWGVLHHTGDLWLAFRNAARFVKVGGLFYVAIYEKKPDSLSWIAKKRKYNQSAWVVRRMIEIRYVGQVFFRPLSFQKWRKSLDYIRNYRKSRGMAFWTDVRDWVGGWPYEPATEGAVVRFSECELGMRKIRVRTGEANIEYLFINTK